MTTDLGVLRSIALFAAMGKALEDVGDTLGDYVLPEGGITAEAAMNRVMEAVDTQKLVRAMRGETTIPEALKVQARTLLKHNPPPEGASIEVSGAWFKMAQNLARYCATGINADELMASLSEEDKRKFREGFTYDEGVAMPFHEQIAPLAMPFNDEGPENRDDRSDGGNSNRC